MKARQKIGIKMVARHAGVGLATASRALSGHPSVSPQMRMKVRQAAKQMGYSPNMLAQSLRTRTTRSVGFVITDIANPLLSSIVGGAEAVLSHAGYSVLLTNSGGVPANDAARIALLAQRQVDGLIVLPAAENFVPVMRAMKQFCGPIVAIDRDMRAPVSAVLSDHQTGMGDAARHLLALGHRNIALLTGPEARPARERAGALIQAYADAGLPRTFAIEEGELSAARGEISCGRLLDCAGPPSALIVGGNQLLEGVLKAAAARGIVIPRDLSLVCCDDSPLARLHSPALAIVGRRTAELGEAAARILLEQLEGTGRPRSLTLETWFEPRASCAPPGH